MNQFELISPYKPTGDQPEAIAGLIAGISEGAKKQTLLGVTGSGKTFTMANIIAQTQKPALIIAHNKTLTAQLAQEFREFFPNNAVHYFVSYYDYYQPEAFVVKTGTYIEKESSINEEIDRLRHAATQSLLSRNDVIIVASVSCIYGLGEKDEYLKYVLHFEVGKEYHIETVLAQLVELQFERSIADFKQSMFLLRGDSLLIFPASSEEIFALDFFGTTLEGIRVLQPITNRVLETVTGIDIFPAKHFMTSRSFEGDIVPRIRAELDERIAFFQSQGKLVEAERIKTKTEYDIEMMLETGYVGGIENYSMYLAGRNPGETPSTLIDFFPKDFITFVDESHISLPQVGGMYAGDRARKENLIQYGFRLPSAFENRPLQFDEFEKKLNTTVYVSATPGPYEQKNAERVHEQIIRPTGLIDPYIFIEEMEFCVDSILAEIQAACERNERALLTTLTKKSSEDLANFLAGNGIKVQYLHSEIETIERLEILRNLRLGVIDVIVGVNLLREGLDLPEVSFIGILDAEKIGFLRSKSALLQIIGRAARNVHGKVLMYSTGKKISIAMKEAIEETQRRRDIQIAYNTAHGIIPKTIQSKIKDIELKGKKEKESFEDTPAEILEAKMKRAELEMDLASANLDFEHAAELRDELIALRKRLQKFR